MTKRCVNGSMQARSNGTSAGTGIAPDSVTMVYSPNADVVKKWWTFSPLRVMRDAPSSRSPFGSVCLNGSHRIGRPRSQ